MAVYAIADLHLDASGQKPMSVFGEAWRNHDEKIFADWWQKVAKADLVLIPGDISWAMGLGEAQADLKNISAMPGTKLLIKGNHDYWWDSLSKLNALNLSDMIFLQNNAYVRGPVGICGTRGWPLEDEAGDLSQHQKILKREAMRLERSLASLPQTEVKIVMLHYPPFGYQGEDTPFTDILKAYQVDICLYGHLHGEGHKLIREGDIKGIRYHCVAADYLDFKLKKII